MRDHAAPAKHRLERVAGESLVFALLEGECREQVLAHDPVLELRGLVEHVDERLAVLDHKRRLRRRVAAAQRDHLRQPAATPGRDAPSHLGHRPHDVTQVLVAHFSSGYLCGCWSPGGNECASSVGSVASAVRWRSTRRSGTSQMSATATYTARPTHWLTNERPIPRPNMSGESLPLRSEPRAARSLDCSPSARSSVVCRM